MKKLIIYILCIIITISFILLNIYISITNSIKEDKIYSSIKEKFYNNFIYDENGNETELFNYILNITNLNKEDLITLMENKKVKDILITYANKIYNYNITLDESYKITKQEIIDIVTNNIDIVTDESNFNLSSEDKQKIIDYTINNTDYIIDKIYSSNIGDYNNV